MGFEEAAIKSIEANRSLRKRGSPYFNRRGEISQSEPGYRAPREDGRAYRLSTQPDFGHFTGYHRIVVLVVLLLIFGMIAFSYWMGHPEVEVSSVALRPYS